MRDPVGRREAFRIAFDIVGFPVSIRVSQKGEVANFLLREDDITIGQNEETPRIRVRPVANAVTANPSAA